MADSLLTIVSPTSSARVKAVEETRATSVRFVYDFFPNSHRAFGWLSHPSSTVVRMHDPRIDQPYVVERWPKAHVAASRRRAAVGRRGLSRVGDIGDHVLFHARVRLGGVRRSGHDDRAGDARRLGAGTPPPLAGMDRAAGRAPRRRTRECGWFVAGHDSGRSVPRLDRRQQSARAGTPHARALVSRGVVAGRAGRVAGRLARRSAAEPCSARWCLRSSYSASARCTATIITGSYRSHCWSVRQCASRSHIGSPISIVVATG